ncbi:pyrimidine dimer DNA glycosylase/endonuclease V [Leifsonia kafniensis]|uniref:Pyrimidine dimer DNA glycosylase/endonuclease V n=1 Tax=Leifsonia kafniensis TaxID=475957 RepID=A0ABP7KNH8_9MICO
MRLWSVHPQYFDRQALTAAWREALLAQAVLIAPGRGYSNHPQLERFREQPAPIDAIADFLNGIVDEADARGYHFAREKITGTVTVRLPGGQADTAPGTAALAVTTGQLQYEWAHLRAKLERRSPDVAERWAALDTPQPHPLFRVVDGPIASWERIAQ